MNVRGLILALSKLDGDLPVLISGYEWGFHDLEVKDLHVRFLQCDVNDTEYGGPHEASVEGFEKALFISRDSLA